MAMARMKKITSQPRISGVIASCSVTPMRGPMSSMNARLAETQIPYCRRLARPLPSTLPNSRSRGLTDESMISTVFESFSFSTDRPMVCP